MTLSNTTKVVRKLRYKYCIEENAFISNISISKWIKNLLKLKIELTNFVKELSIISNLNHPNITYSRFKI